MVLRAAALAVCALLAGAAQAQSLRVVETGDVGLRLEIDGKPVDIDAVLMRAPVATGALFVDLSREDDLRATALRRGVSVAFLDLARVPEPLRAAALRALIPRLAQRAGAARVLARAQGAAATMLIGAASVIDGLLLIDAPPAPDIKARVVEVWGSDAYWRAAPRSAPAPKEPPTRRSFYLAGVAAAAAQSECAAPVNARRSAPALRALFAVLDDWTKGVAPPASRTAGAGDLAPAQTLVWPKGAGLPAPPAGARLVPTIDADGNERAGLRLPDQALPIATYTGFNAPKDKEECAAGAAIPFAATRADREKIGDGRLSLVERYGSRAYFVATMRVVADRLVKERLLLPEDADAYVAAAKSAPF